MDKTTVNPPPIEAVAGKPGCPSTATPCQGGGQLRYLPESIREKIFNHPCFSEEAHHYYARMHVAVAPACNIQCHYCNRKFDCANESRPGVSSELLSPAAAVRKVLAVAARIPELSVVGIAGPGDPLANPERIFATFQGLSEQLPDLRLCLSTNGLKLPEYVDRLAQYRIEHVSITINCIDPLIGAQIYPWIFWKHRRIRGHQASAILIEQQLQGLEQLQARGVLVKVNSVLIPGINDAHLKEVNKEVRLRGAFVHNIMPLIASPEHGTYYGLHGQRNPTPEELAALRDVCTGDLRVMRHCHQCRADAVGLLGEDRGQEFTQEKLADAQELDYPQALSRRVVVQAALRRKVMHHREPTAVIPLFTASGQGRLRSVVMAIATTGDGLVNQAFHATQELLLYEVSAAGMRLLKRHTLEPNVASGGLQEEPPLLQILDVLQGCEVLLSGRIGMAAWQALEAAGIHPNVEHGLEPIEAAARQVYREVVAAGPLSPVPFQQISTSA